MTNQNLKTMNLFPAQGLKDITKTPYQLHHEEIEILKQKIQFLRRSKGIEEPTSTEPTIPTKLVRNEESPRYSGKFFARTIPKQTSFNQISQQTKE